MKIGVDARMYGLEHAGIGRYVQSLIRNLLPLDKQSQYTLFVRKSQKEEVFSDLKSQTSSFKLVIAEARHYSLKEQFLMPFLIGKEKVDLMHFPHFNVPLLYSGKYVVTIHDLIKHHSKGSKTTTKSPLLYWLKYLGYKLVFSTAIKRTCLIFVPSNTIAGQLVREYHLDPAKVRVTYEGVDKKLDFKTSENIQETLDKYQIKKPFLLYVGSVYPHKNVGNLIKAMKMINQPKINLVVVCARSVFWERLKKEVESLAAEDFVNLVGFVLDRELTVLYRQAEAFVFPSVSEGFGLPGLEAMANGLPVLASDIPVFREVYQKAALYFNSLDPKDISEKIKEFLLNPRQKDYLISEGSKVVKLYSWGKMAKETLDGYRSV